MPKLEYFLVCESISVDQTTNRISLFHVLEDIQIQTPQTASGQPVLPQFVAVVCWNREHGDEDKDFQAMLRLHLPGQKPNEEPKEFPMNFKMEQPRYRLMFNLQGMPKLQTGKLKFELVLNNQHCAWHSVNVVAPSNESPNTDKD